MFLTVRCVLLDTTLPIFLHVRQVAGDVDFEGGDLLPDSEHFLTPDAAGCCKACQQHANCSVWSWGDNTSGCCPHRCYLKDLSQTKQGCTPTPAIRSRANSPVVLRTLTLPPSMCCVCICGVSLEPEHVLVPVRLSFLLWVK